MKLNKSSDGVGKYMKYLQEDELKNLEKIMEEMANAPREEMGKRTPGERCAFEIPVKNLETD